MAFRFGLETVLKVRKWAEDAAQREFAEAQAKVDAALRELEAMYKRIDEVRIEIAAAEREGRPDKIEYVRTMEGFIEGQKIRIGDARMKLRELLMIAEAKQEALILAAREKKVLVKLKEKKRSEYVERMRILELKEMDDLTSMRVARRKK